MLDSAAVDETLDVDPCSRSLCRDAGHLVLNWAAFTFWVVWVQLYYQTYLNLTPIQTMFRVLPMYFIGILANVIIALAIGRIDVYLISRYVFVLRFTLD
jgi:hypothetical protein